MPLAACMGALVALPGCAFLRELLGSLREPTLAFRSADVRGMSLEGATLELTFALANPNPIGLSLSTVEYALEVEGRPVVSGAPARGLSIPPQGTATLAFPATFRFADLAPTLDALLTQDQVAWRARGRVGVATPIGEIALPFERSGTIPIPRPPRVAFGPPRLSALNLTGARIVLALRLTNPNAFALPLSGIGGSVSIAGAPVGQVSTGPLAALGPTETRTIDVPVDVNFLHAGFAAANAIRTGQADVTLQGRIDTGAGSLPVRLAEHLLFGR